MAIFDRKDTTKMVRDEYLTARGFIRRQQWTAPVAADPDRVLNDQATSSSVITTVTSFVAQPDFPRNVTITPGGTTADVPAGDITVTGTNIRDEVITEALTLAANASTLKAGLKAFKTVTSIVFPIQDGAAATYDVGIADVLGLDRAILGDTVLAVTADGVYETTRPTVVANANVESSTMDPNTAADAAVDFVSYYITQELTDKDSTTT